MIAVDKIALRNALYEADAVTMTGIKIINTFPSFVVPDEGTQAHSKKETQAEWLREEEYDEKEDWPIRNVFFACSACTKRERKTSDYCPNCGAKMH